LLFAATHPERTCALVIIGSFARIGRAEDYPFGSSAEQMQGVIDQLRERWGTGVLLSLFAPSVAHDPAARAAWARYQRRGSSPGAAVALMRMCYEIDARPVLPSISAPALILHRTDDRLIGIEHARYLARHIPNATLREFAGADHLFWAGDADAYLDAIEEFLTGERPALEHERVLATVLFADIVGSTQKAAALGDARWRHLLEGFYNVARRQIERFRGREIDSAGDGMFAAFDGPARAVRCAAAITDGVRRLGVDVRCGVHTGECEVIGEKIGGLAVHIGARVAGQAAPGEVLVSSTTKDLVAGSGLSFVERGLPELKGVRGRWALYAVAQG